ncbi:methyltransferase domain-containing protein [Actinotignum schaalii]|nr:methyltransferase domain-containing protein [Actinotignum schaalii]
MDDNAPLPQSDRPTATAAGHWVLARAGKRVLRPGGLHLTKAMLEHAQLASADVVEFAPGLGRTAELIISEPIHSYTGVDQDKNAVTRVKGIVEKVGGVVVNSTAQKSGLPDAGADVVVGEAMLTMQGASSKAAIVGEAFRLLRPGGRYAIHELSLTPDSIDPAIADTLRKGLAQTIRVNARPLTQAEWRQVLTDAGFEVEWVGDAPMALLSLRRNLADEGLRGVARILRNVLRDKELRARVLAMRALFRKYRHHLAGVAMVARKPVASADVAGAAESTGAAGSTDAGTSATTAN